MSKNLLKSNRFLPLLITQFLGALNDNLFKNALLTMVAFKMTDKADILSNIIAGLFILPFFLFSATAGEVADKYNRAAIARVLKITELLLMCAVAFVFYTENLTLLVILLALMGTQSAFFGPIKYALLPQLLNKDELISANAYVEATTYTAILLGLILGTLLPVSAAIAVLIALALCGVIASQKIPDAPAPRPNAEISKNIFKALSDTFKIIYKNQIVFKSILGATWFWTIGALVAVQIYPLAGQILHASAGVITFFLITFSLGVAFGSLTCGKIMKGLIHATYLPISALGMGLSLYALYALTKNYQTPSELITIGAFFSTPSADKITVALFLLAFFGGMYIVPLNALMQTNAPKAYTAAVIAGNNILNAFGMALVAVLAVVLLSMGVTIPELFLFASIANLFVFLYIAALLPDALLRSVFQAVLGILYRVRLQGIDNIKRARTNTIIIANHTSLLDGLLIAAFMPEKITFAINTEWAKTWYVKFFGLVVRFLPVDPTSPFSIREMIDEVQKGSKLMIFPEGRITTTGGLMKVYEGAGVIAERANARILPIRINGAQYSKLSYMNNKFKTRLFPKITMTILKPMKIEISDKFKGRDRRHAISLKLYELMADMIYKTSDVDENIFTSLLDAAKTHGWNHKIAEDITRKPQTYNSFIKKSYVLGAAYEKAFTDEKYIGLMLPNMLVNVISFFALESVDKVPVMVNFSQGVAQVTSSLKTVGVKTVLTSKKFIEQARLEHLEAGIENAGVKLVYLEDFAKEISLKTKLKGFARHLLCRLPENKAEETAVVLFTSGSEGMPKAVLLSHKNLQANRYQVSTVIAFNSTDVFFNALPMFHSFGLSVGTILTMLFGVRTFFYPSPLHYRIVPELVYDTNATIICGTDTFFYGYGRMGHPYDFFNVKYAVVGGEKLKDQTYNLWMDKFGVRLLEGYGTTETSPVLCINTPMHRKSGSVGRLLPGVKYKLEPVSGIEEGGKLLVSGDNIMQGYMKADAPEKLQPPVNNWYDTGDIVSLDDDGFVTIHGRAKRFAKIAGEMVSLTAVEAALDKLYTGYIQGIVTLPDEKKGEQMIFITAAEQANLAEIKTFFKTEGFSELWVPKKVIYQKKPPVLGTGKFDYQTAKKELETL
ncbi:MAG: acyl-[ACP]--phospholipid O-acyltransferase [Acetobacter sp.]|nr:acyl-[ACP]--phospholipid O-acyltransferase [Acetobacter sp.]